MADIYKGNKDTYKEKIVSKVLVSTKSGKCSITAQLQNDCGEAISLDRNIIEIIRGYYQGKVIMVGE